MVLEGEHHPPWTMRLPLSEQQSMRVHRFFLDWGLYRSIERKISLVPHWLWIKKDSSLCKRESSFPGEASFEVQNQEAHGSEQTIPYVLSHELLAATIALEEGHHPPRTVELLPPDHQFLRVYRYGPWGYTNCPLSRGLCCGVEERASLVPHWLWVKKDFDLYRKGSSFSREAPSKEQNHNHEVHGVKRTIPHVSSHESLAATVSNL